MDRQEGGGHMKRLACMAAGIGLVVLVGLAGCRNHYPETMKYPVRTDPLVLKAPDLTKKTKWLEPDRPGQLPIFSLKDLRDERNPLYNPDDPTGKGLVEVDILRDPTMVPVDQREMLGHGLNALFGTPALPKVQVDEALVTAMKVDMPFLKEGSRLYRIHCLHCHGVSGDGRGPTARWINPHPRDFRRGIFKFQSVKGASRPPRREDLHRIIQNGVEGTAMPSFVLLKKEEIEAMVSYVIHLSIRGQAEFETLAKEFSVLDGALVSKKTPKGPEGKPIRPGTEAEKKDLQEKIFRDLESFAQTASRAWAESQKKEAVITHKDNPWPGEEGNKEKQREHFQSMLRGRYLFLGGPTKDAALHEKISGKVASEGKWETIALTDFVKGKDLEVLKDKARQANCVECHTDYGRRAEYRWDEWGTEVKPRNFTDGIFRGGRRAQDVFFRIHSGINGSLMQAYSTSLEDERIWDLVNFVRALGYPRMREGLGID